MTITQLDQYCKFRAKYNLVSHNNYYCAKHALSQSNKILEYEYKNIEDIPELYLMEESNFESNEIFDNIKDIHQISLSLVSKNYKSVSLIELIVKDSNNDEYVLKIAKTFSSIEKFTAGSSMYACVFKTMTDPICVPIINNNQYLVRGSKYNSWYYELTNKSFPLLHTNNKKLILRLVKLIEMTHLNRIIHGSIDPRNLVQLNRKKISSTVFATLHNAIFWVNRYGTIVESDASIDSTIKYDSLYCSRRLQAKKYPGRYDDYESLLFLSHYLTTKKLPWIDMTSSVDIIAAKELFLQEHLSEISKVILNSCYEDRPNYQLIYNEFEKIL